jgi:hypothetical protein
LLATCTRLRVEFEYLHAIPLVNYQKCTLVVSAHDGDSRQPMQRVLRAQRPWQPWQPSS